MLTACREAGLAPPIWEELAMRFRVTIYSDGHTAGSGRPDIDATNQAILEALEPADGLSTREIAAAIGLTARATRSRLLKLVERGLVRDIGTSPQDPMRRYFRTG